MVMRPAPPKRKPLLPRLRFHPLCLFGHKLDSWRLEAPHEKWATFISICVRCNRVVGDSYAVRRNK